MSNKEEIKEIENILKSGMSKDEREFYEERAKIFKEKMEAFENKKIDKNRMQIICVLFLWFC